MKDGFFEIDLSEIMERVKGKTTTVGDHYGVKDETYDKWVKDILCDIIQHDNKGDVIDKHFPKISAEDRAKIVAFAQALNEFKKMSGR